MSMLRTSILLAAPAVLALSAIGCSTEVGQSEVAGSATQASSTNGVAAALTVNVSGSTYTGTLKVTNNTAEALTNWQVLVSMGPRPSDQNKMLMHVQRDNTYQSGAACVTGAFVNDLGNNTLFMPMPNTANISAGGSQTITWTGDWNGTTPSVLTVDGMASGTANAGNAADGIDPIALSAASTALSIATHYESDKLSNNGDSNYSIYDQTIWSAQSFRIASGNTTIEYDPSAPGYAFVPGSVKSALAVAQMDASVASYLTAGLVSCLSVSDGRYVYAFRADFLKGFSYPTLHNGTVTNKDNSVDTFSASGSAVNKGQSHFNITASSGPTNADPNFGILRLLDGSSTFPTYWTAVYPKFNATNVNLSIGPNPGSWHGQFGAACSPFNGPGGTSNPYFVLSQKINGVQQNLKAWFQGVGSGSCNNGCTASFSVDPIPYTQPAAYYDINSQLVGPQGNPFAAISSNLYADPAHSGQWATRTVGGIQQWGTFSSPQNVLGTTVYQYVKQM